MSSCSEEMNKYGNTQSPSEARNTLHKRNNLNDLDSKEQYGSALLSDYIQVDLQRQNAWNALIAVLIALQKSL